MNSYGRTNYIERIYRIQFDAVVQVIDGEGLFIIGGEEHALKAGELIIMPANVPHAVRAVQKFKMLLIMLRA